MRSRWFYEIKLLESGVWYIYCVYRLFYDVNSSGASDEGNDTFFSMARQPVVGLGLITVDVSISHLEWLLWTSDRPVAETSSRQNTALTRQTSMPSAVFEPAVLAIGRPQNQTLRPRDHWDRQWDINYKNEISAVAVVCRQLETWHNLLRMLKEYQCT